ncbi:hypothetical protein L596_018393 [Steinernema carpocapsae]|uniref:Uncharacterized protein n=1 Tax=Steinernema carpocapsae TaxID=34508 RepID=A0A4U5N5I3_STECR|nr:hypothetical protein L596_018393 [Steinernema carpocapsae]
MKTHRKFMNRFCFHLPRRRRSTGGGEEVKVDGERSGITYCFGEVGRGDRTFQSRRFGKVWLGQGGYCRENQNCFGLPESLITQS